MKTDRRKFLQLAALSGAAVMSNGLDSFSHPGDKIKFISPVDGDMLCEYDGKYNGKCLITKVKVQADPGSKIRINGINAEFSDSIFTAEVCLKKYENKIEAVDEKTGSRQAITIYKLGKIINKYRLSLDDNIWFLKDIAQNSDNYKSIFENPYIGMYKDLHDTYGTKVHFNIYYQTDGFNLSQMPAKYKSQWKDNSDWIRLSFHALQNDPDRPYINAGYDQVKNDCEKVKEQIRRFAGDEVMGPVTTLHWGESTVEGARALRDSGYKALAGYFNVDDGQSPVSYYLNEEQRRNLKKRFIWKDNAEGIIFGRIALVINTLKKPEILPYLDSLKHDGRKPGFLDLMIHEQYFYPSYIAYQPDYREKVFTSVKWAADNGYKPAFLSECIFK